MILKAQCSYSNFMLLRSTNSNPMSLRTTSGSRPSRTQNRRIQREVLRCIPRRFLYRWGERITGRGNYLTPNGPHELGIISMENGRCSYTRIGSCSQSSSRLPSASSSPAKQPASLPLAAATALDETFAPILHEHLLPLSPADASAIAHGNGSTGSFVPQTDANPLMDAGQHPHPAISHRDSQNFVEQHLYSQPGASGLPYFYTYNYSTASNVHGSLFGGVSPTVTDQPWASSPNSTFAGSYDGGLTSPCYASASPGDWSPAPSQSTHEGAYDGYLAAGGSHLEVPSAQRH